MFKHYWIWSYFGGVVMISLFTLIWKFCNKNRSQLRHWKKRIYRACGSDWIEPSTTMILRELFVYYVQSGRPITDALRGVLIWGAIEISLKIDKGSELTDALGSIAMPLVEDQNLVRGIKTQMQRSQERSTDDLLTANRMHLNHAGMAFYIVTSGGGVGGIPTPECIKSHLPKGRKPTSQELRDAWEACAHV